MNNNTILNKWSNQAVNVIQKLRVIFLSLSIPGIAKKGNNTFYKYECEYTICALYKPQTGFCKYLER